MKMTSALKSLTFTTVPKVDTNPAMVRRREIIARLEQQRRLAADPSYTRTIKTKDGQKQQKVLPWWRLNVDGSYAFVVRSGFAPIEFEKGKTAIAVASLDKLPGVIDVVINAVRNGELDEQLRPTKRPTTAKRK
jgi:hypothetical protein